MRVNFQQEKKYVGHIDQLFRVERHTLEDGKAKGTSMIDVHNRSGMSFSVNLDRGMDIPYLSYHGENFGFLAPCGIVAPAYFDDHGLGFLKSFTAGFLTTCGLHHAGAPCEYEGTIYGLHGRISHTPATQAQYAIIESDHSAAVEIKGTVTDASIFGDKLRLDRRIRCAYREKKLTIQDRVTNDGYKTARHMILYHMNIGYPLLSPESEIYIPSISVMPRDEHAKTGLTMCRQMQEADPNYQEMCYYHKFLPDADGFATVAVFHPALDLGVAIRFDTRTLDHFMQWKMMGAKDYVMGLEPGNSTIDGIADAIENGSMKYLEPQQSVDYCIEIHILSSRQEFLSIKGGAQHD